MGAKLQNKFDELNPSKIWFIKDLLEFSKKCADISLKGKGSRLPLEFELGPNSIRPREKC